MVADFFADVRWVLQQRKVLLIIVIGILYRLFLAAFLPLVNDEAYYWDWGRHPQLSFYDHPGFVGWLSWAAKVFPGTLSARFYIPFFHAFTFISLAATLAKWQQRSSLCRQSIYWLLLCIQVLPFFNLGGVLLMPDAGLLLFLSLALYACIDLANGQRPFTLTHAVWLGICFGLAGTAKYHAAPLGLGALGALLYQRRQRLTQEYMRWIVLIFVGLLCVSPVLIWNYQNHFISFRYQSEHGFGDSRFNLTPALQTLVAQFLLIGPLLFANFLAWVFGLRSTNLSRSAEAKLIWWTSLPLTFLLLGTSFFKQTLPHWLLPAVVAALPLLSIQLALSGVRFKTAFRLQAVIFGSLILILVSLFSFSTFRRYVTDTILQERPSSFGTEITIWERLAEFFRKQDGQQLLLSWSQYINQSNLPAWCPTQPYIGSLRWFWVAQLGYHLPGQPLVVNFDPRFPSYYSFRDRALKIENCPIIIIGSQKHFAAEELAEYVALEHRAEIPLPGHRDQALFIGFGLGKKLPQIKEP